MKDEFIIEEPDELAENRVPEARPGKDGIEVDESIDIENIELHSRPSTAVGNLGWETVQTDNDLEALFEGDVLDWRPDEQNDEAQSQLSDLEDEHLHLAAELADLRRAATERELALQEQLSSARAKLRAHEAELSDQEAQIASLTLESEGLRAQLSEHDYDTPLQFAGVGMLPSVGAESTGTTSVVKNLKQRLEERANALKVAREEAERLQRERTELAGALAERGSQVAKLLARLTRSARRFHLQDEFKTGLGKLLGQPLPGSEEPTLAVDEPAEASAAPPAPAPGPEPELEAVTAATEPDSAPAAERRVHTAAARIVARQRRRRTDVGIRRYLIALDPTHEEVCELADRRMYVGRGDEADIRVTDATASRLHAVLYLERGSTVVEDACSTNGVYVNMQRVRRAVLLDGDTVVFGAVRFQYRVGPAVASQD